MVYIFLERIFRDGLDPELQEIILTCNSFHPLKTYLRNNQKC